VDSGKTKVPEEPVQTIEQLNKPLTGLQCRTCRYITTNKDVIRVHCKKHHGLAWVGDKSQLYSIVQTFFSGGGLQKYFLVEYDAILNAENLDVDDTVQPCLGPSFCCQPSLEPRGRT
jgi:hypothetical protein